MKKSLLLSMATFAVSVFAGQAHAINCSGIPDWNAATVYATAGTAVKTAGNAYTNKWWTQGENPTASGQWGVWALTGACDGTTTSSSKSSVSSSIASSVKSSTATTSSSSSVVVGNNCTSVNYVAGTNYTAGQLVQNAGNEYRCDIAGWCSSTAAWAYAPGTGTYWTSAWTLVRSCSTTVSSVSTSSSSSKSSTTTTSSSVGSTGSAPAFVYGAYHDVTVNTNWNTSGLQGFNTSGSLLPIAQAMPSGMKTLTWAFVTGECGSSAPTPTGENVAGMDPATFAATNVAAFVNSNKSYIVAVGGAAGAFTCATDSGFTTFINHYKSANMIGVDFDIEGGRLNATQIRALVDRVKAAQSTYPNMRFSFTIPTLGQGPTGPTAVDMGASSPDSLGDDGHMVMAAIKAAGLTKYTINLMTMDYGPASTKVCVVSGSQCQEGQTAIQAAMNLHYYYGVPYNQIEITPEIPNDDGGVPFSLNADVPNVANFIKSKGLAGLHFWAYERDTNGLPYGTGFASALGL